MGDGRPICRDLFLGRALVHGGRRRLRLASRAFELSRAPASVTVRTDGGCDADLQRGAVTRLRRNAGDHRRRRAHGPRLSVRLFLPLGHHRRQRLDRRGAGVHRHPRAPAASAHLLSPKAQEFEPQGRQHCGLCHAMGRPLSADAGARRRQRDVGRRHRPPGGRDGGGPGQRHYPEPAARHQPQHDVRAFAAIRGPHHRPGSRRRSHRVDGARRQLLGP